MAGTSLRDRFFTRQVARAITSPLGILLGGAVAAATIVAGVPLVAALPLGVAAWAGKVALSIPRDRRERIDPFTLGPLDFSSMQTALGLTFSGPIKYYYMLLTVMVLILAVNVRLQNSRIGRAWEAVREDETAARAMGINTTHMKLLAFAMGASFGGVAGGMFAAIQGFISPESFILVESILVVSMVVLGGMGNIWGVVLGALLLSFVPEILRWTVEPMQRALFGHMLVEPEVIRMLIFGFAMVLIMLYRPAGLLPSAVRKRELTAHGPEKVG